MMVFLVPIIAIILLIWAIDAIYYADETKVTLPKEKMEINESKKEHQNYLDKYIKKK